MGEVTADDGSVLPVAATFAGAPSLTVDAVIVPCGDIASLLSNGDAVYYLLEAYKHLKPIALSGDARQFKARLNVADQGEDGIVEGDNVDDAFMTVLFDLLAAHRVWSRSSKIDQIPACRWRLRLPGLHFDWFCRPGKAKPPPGFVLKIPESPQPIPALGNRVFQRRRRQHLQLRQRGQQ